MVNIELIHGPEGRVKIYGPYPFAQFTYNALRVGEEGEVELAWFENGIWITDDGAQWTDITINAEPI